MPRVKRIVSSLVRCACESDDALVTNWVGRDMLYKGGWKAIDYAN